MSVDIYIYIYTHTYTYIYHKTLLKFQSSIFTRSLYFDSLSKYCRTRKNVQRYCTPKHPIRYIL